LGRLSLQLLPLVSNKHPIFIQHLVATKHFGRRNGGICGLTPVLAVLTGML
jgi:hypothetical protein